MTKSRPSTKTTPALPPLLATGAILAVGIGLLAAQSRYSKGPSYEYSLAKLEERIPVLQAATDPVKRDQYCIPLSAYGRALDHAIAPDARVFMGGMLGETNGGRMGLYYFLRNYLFPRHLAISLDGKAVLTDHGAEGTPCDSPEELKKHGFDLYLNPTPEGSFQLVPLTEKGVPK